MILSLSMIKHQSSFFCFYLKDLFNMALIQHYGRKPQNTILKLTSYAGTHNATCTLSRCIIGTGGPPGLFPENIFLFFYGNTGFTMLVQDMIVEP